MYLNITQNITPFEISIKMEYTFFFQARTIRNV